MILAQLFGEQTLPNLLAALAVAPTGLVHVRSADKKFSAPIRGPMTAAAGEAVKKGLCLMCRPGFDPAR